MTAAGSHWTRGPKPLQCEKSLIHKARRLGSVRSEMVGQRPETRLDPPCQLSPPSSQLGPISSETVVQAVPIKVMEMVQRLGMK
jgi:hypothetical protein